MTNGNNNGRINRKQLKEVLSDIQYHITQQGGTENPFSGEYYKNDAEGIYVCAYCPKPTGLRYYINSASLKFHNQD